MQLLTGLPRSSPSVSHGAPCGHTRPHDAAASRCTAHVTLRLCRGLPNLRERRLIRTLQRCLLAARERLGCRIVHYSVQRDHLHLVMEARGKEALSRGVRGLSIRIARAVNGLLGSSGKVIADRYHARALRTPREVRSAIRYVLCNARRHGRSRGLGYHRDWLDPCSSASWFNGWKNAGRKEPDDDAPVVAPRVWLLRVGWRRLGLLDTGEVPGLSP